jgi:capsular polysaccharide biosynthesis protein
MIGGFVGGLVIGIGLAVVFEVMDPRLRRPQLIEEASGLSIIAFMPRTTDHAVA